MLRAGLELILVATTALACVPATGGGTAPPKSTAASSSLASAGDEPAPTKVVKTEEEWRSQLSAEQFVVLREKGTERPFRGAYWDNHKAGLYRCAGCGLVLFSSDTKFDSGTGWPSFWAPSSKSHVDNIEDKSHGMTRTEVTCARCGGHLGHIFEDGPKPTHLRYCINSVSLQFEPAESK